MAETQDFEVTLTRNAVQETKVRLRLPEGTDLKTAYLQASKLSGDQDWTTIYANLYDESNVSDLSTLVTKIKTDNDILE